jgi:hypothetical protein
MKSVFNAVAHQIAMATSFKYLLRCSQLVGSGTVCYLTPPPHTLGLRVLQQLLPYPLGTYIIGAREFISSTQQKNCFRKPIHVLHALMSTKQVLPFLTLSYSNRPLLKSVYTVRPFQWFDPPPSPPPK